MITLPHPCVKRCLRLPVPLRTSLDPLQILPPRLSRRPLSFSYPLAPTKLNRAIYRPANLLRQPLPRVLSPAYLALGQQSFLLLYSEHSFHTPDLVAFLKQEPRQAICSRLPVVPGVRSTLQVFSLAAFAVDSSRSRIMLAFPFAVSALGCNNPTGFVISVGQASRLTGPAQVRKPD